MCVVLQLKLAEEEKAERSKQMRELKEKLDKLEQLLLDSVPRKDYLKAQEDAKRGLCSIRRLCSVLSFCALFQQVVRSWLSFKTPCLRLRPGP